MSDIDTINSFFTHEKGKSTNVVSNGKTLKYRGYEISTWVGEGIIVLRRGPRLMDGQSNDYIRYVRDHYPKDRSTITDALGETPPDLVKMAL